MNTYANYVREKQSGHSDDSDDSDDSDSRPLPFDNPQAIAKFVLKYGIPCQSAVQENGLTDTASFWEEGYI